MTTKEALKAMCEHCHRNIQAQPSKGDLPHKECPWRHISNDYCQEYDIVREALDKAEKQAEILRIIKESARKGSDIDGDYIWFIDINEQNNDYNTIKSWLEEKR